MNTINKIDSYIKQLMEQAEVDPIAMADAPIDATDVTEQPPEDAAPLTVEGERYLIDLLVKAFLHTPDETEGKIVKELQASLLKKNPKDVAESIESLLEISPNDTKSVLGLTTDMN